MTIWRDSHKTHTTHFSQTNDVVFTTTLTFKTMTISRDRHKTHNTHFIQTNDVEDTITLVYVS